MKRGERQLLIGAAFTLQRRFGLFWSWRTLMRLGGDYGVAFTREGAKRAARAAIRSRQKAVDGLGEMPDGEEQRGPERDAKRQPAYHAPPET
jgi:hypothetical protein